MRVKLTEQEKKQRRMAVRVAQDVLALLAAEKKLKVKQGVYVGSRLTPDEVVGDEKDSRKTAKQLLTKGCEACALGTCLLATVARYNAFDFAASTQEHPFYLAPDRHFVIYESATYKRLEEVFPPAQQSLIESAFEMDEFAHNIWDEDHEDRMWDAIAFGKHYRSARGRLKAIMENVVANRGVFVPPVRKWRVCDGDDLFADRQGRQPKVAA